jgi:hypothetical protein
MKELKLEVKIEEINVDDGFYEVHYKYRVNGKKWETDMYDGDFDNGMSDKLWKKELEKGVAMESVLQKISEEIEF